MEHIATFTAEIISHGDFFETVFTDSRDCTKRRIRTEKLEMSDADARRQALNGMFYIIGYVLRQKAFPEDTQLYRTEKFPDGSAKSFIVGYPDDIRKKSEPVAA